MKLSIRILLAFVSLFVAPQLFGQTSTQNNILQGRVLYQSSGSKPAVGVQIKEKDSNGDYSKDKGEYRLVFQRKRNGEVLALEISSDTREGKKIELVNKKEVKAAKLPASAEEALDIIVCPAGQRDLAAQRYYNIIKTTRDKELDKLKKGYETLVAEKKLDWEQIQELYAKLDEREKQLDSAKIKEQALNIASINTDKASKAVKKALKKLSAGENVEEVLKVLDKKEISKSWRQNSAIKKQADIGIKQAIEAYELTISLLEPQFRYGDIVESYDSIIMIYETEKYDQLKLSEYINQAAIFLGSNGNYKKSLDYYKKSLAIREALLKPFDLNLATSYNNIAIAYGDLDDYEQALLYSKKALSIRQAVLDSMHPDITGSYINIATIYNKKSDYQQALIYNKLAVNILETLSDSNSLILATVYNNIASIYESLDKYELSLEFRKKDIAISEASLAKNDPRIAISYNNIAGTYLALNEDSLAIFYLKKSVLIRETILNPQHPDLAGSYQNIAFLYNKIGEYNLALEFANKSKLIYEAILDTNNLDLAVCYITLASIYGNMGNFEEALPFNKKTIKIRMTVLDSLHEDLAASYNDIAITLSGLKKYDEAIIYLVKSINIFEKILPVTHSKRGILYSNLGVLYAKNHQFIEAHEAFQKRQDFKSDGRAFRNWAMYYALQNDKPRALENLQKAVSLGYKDLKWITTDDSLENIWGEQAYKDLVEQLQKQ